MMKSQGRTFHEAVVLLPQLKQFPQESLRRALAQPDPPRSAPESLPPPMATPTLGT